MSYLLETFGAVTLPTAHPSSDIGSGPSRVAVVSLADGSVYDSYGTAQYPRGQNSIPYSAYLTGADMAAIQSAHQALLALRGTRNTLWRRLADGTRQWCYARLTQVKGTRQAENVQHLPVALEFLMLSKDWYSEDATAHVAGDLLTDDEDLATVGAEGDYDAYPVPITVTNDGAQWQPNVTITVQAGTGNVTALTLANVSTGHTINWGGTVLGGTIPAGGRLVIDSGAHSCMVYPFVGAGTADYTHLTPPTNKVDWFALASGYNDVEITLTEAGSGASVTIEFYPAWG